MCALFLGLNKNTTHLLYCQAVFLVTPTYPCRRSVVFAPWPCTFATRGLCLLPLCSPSAPRYAPW